ncbi:MAG: sensor histidine kinase, partial [Eggerthella lenta]
AGALACALFATVSLRRYRQSARLASEVDEVLHGGRRIAVSDYREGDLAVLRNELAKMVAALRTATERLDAEKNALADALADVSHQIRTPLTAMGLLIGTAERTSDEAERIRALHELETLVSRVGWLVTALLKLAKADAGAIRVQARPVDAARLVRDALAPLAGAFDLRDVACETHVDEGASFNGDAAWSAEALGNILKNCMEPRPPDRNRVEWPRAPWPSLPCRHGPGHRRRTSPPVRALLPRRGIEASASASRWPRRS